MLRFLFSFCDAEGDAAEIEPKDEELMVAFEKARELANEPNTPLRKNLSLA
jgi:penicillin V acylase-like amidase (Ntn superfamily)